MSEKIEVSFDLDQLRGPQLAAALEQTCALERMARSQGRDTLAAYWHANLEILLAVALREQAEDGQSIALARFHSQLKAGGEMSRGRDSLN